MKRPNRRSNTPTLRLHSDNTAAFIEAAKAAEVDEGEKPPEKGK